MDAAGFIDVPFDFAPQLLDRTSGDIFDISDQHFTISQPQQQQQPQASPISASLSTWAAEAARADAELASLRRVAFRLVCSLLPQLELAPDFDCTTGHTDRLLLALCAALDATDADIAAACRREFAGPGGELRPVAVSLCAHPASCLGRLRCRILRLLSLLLPGLALPPALQAALSASASASASLLTLSLLIDRIVRHSKRRRSKLTRR